MTSHDEHGEPAAASPEMIDPKTDEILLEISLAAHDHGKSLTEHLTAFPTRPGPKINLVIPHLSERSSEQSYVDRGIEHAYRSRLYTRSSDARPNASPFAKDYARIIHSPSFRKLQGKSQLVPAGENYFFRTRLTHSLEVAEIATRIAFKLIRDGFTEHLLDPNLVASAALLHDIGHPPFGHSGEYALHRKMEDFGGFEGNAQTLRLVTRLENRLGRGGTVQDVYAEPRGLNLTVGTLASIIKYDRMYDGPKDEEGNLCVKKAYYREEKDIVSKVKERLHVAPEERLYTIECQIMDIADDIAYFAYDLEDTMEAGIVTPFDFISVDDEMLERIRVDVLKQYKKRSLNGEADGGFEVSHGDIVEELAKVFATILVYADPKHPYNLEEWTQRVVFVGRSHLEAVMHAKNPLIRRQFLETLIEGNIEAIRVELDGDRPFMSKLKIRPDRLLTIEVMKSFNYHKVISSRKFQVPRYRGGYVVESLFDIFEQDTEGRLLSERLRTQLKRLERGERMRLIADRIAALTDVEALRLHNQLNGGRDSSLFEYDE